MFLTTWLVIQSHCYERGHLPRPTNSLHSDSVSRYGIHLIYCFSCLLGTFGHIIVHYSLHMRIPSCVKSREEMHRSILGFQHRIPLIGAHLECITEVLAVSN